MIHPTEALRIVLDNVSPLPGQSPQATEARGLCVVAEPVLADRDIPPADVSRMDGYAVIAPVAAGAKLQLVGEIPAGRLPDKPIEAHECCRIFTGAVLPPNANAVLEQEAAHQSSDTSDSHHKAVTVTGVETGDCHRLMVTVTGLVRAGRDVAPGENVTARGSVARRGAALLPAGAPLGAAQAAVCAAVGRTPRTGPTPRIAILCTGEEVVPEGVNPEPHQTRDANGPAIGAAAGTVGASVTLRRIVPDDAEQLTDALQAILDNDAVDCLVTIGGVSVGEYDLVPGALEAIGARVLVHGVASKPGKPFLFAMAPNSKPVFGLPGNVLSALASFFGLVAPALRKMAGRPEPWDPTLPVRLSGAVAGDRERTCFVLARVQQDAEGQWIAQPVPAQHSADVAAAARADGVVTVPPGDAGLEAGAATRFRPWRPLW